MPFDAEFDAVICLCQGAFGLMTADGDDERVLGGIARALRPGGRLALSAFNAYFAVKYHEAATFDADRGVSHERTEVRDAAGRGEGGRPVDRVLHAARAAPAARPRTACTSTAISSVEPGALRRRTADHRVARVPGDRHAPPDACHCDTAAAVPPDFGLSTACWYPRQVQVRPGRSLSLSESSTSLVRHPRPPRPPAPPMGTFDEEGNYTPRQITADDLGMSFADAIDGTMVEVEDGQLVNGTVVKIDQDEVLLDIGYKSEGVIPARELSIRNDVNPHEIVVARREDRGARPPEGGQGRPPRSCPRSVRSTSGRGARSRRSRKPTAWSRVR